MSNHHHLVLHINKPKALHWTDHEVCERWHKLYKGTALTHKYLLNEPLCKAELFAVQLKLDDWRLHLCDISWFMRTLNEPIARMANAEDKCTGHFWQARFNSQALLDEKALAACMAYVDLNPVRARMTETPEQSEHTSIQKRIRELRETGEQPKLLASFVGNPREPMPQGLPFKLEDYINLLDLTGRAIRDDKRGYIENNLPNILDRLEIKPKQWFYLTTQFESRFKNLVGSAYALKKAATHMGYRRSPGLCDCKALL